MTPREIVSRAWPWATNAERENEQPCQRLRDHGKFMATGGRGMNPVRLKRLDNCLKTLRASNLVLEFDPSHGFGYQDRVPEDGDLLIRVNEHTTLTDEGAMIWRWPPHLSDSEPLVPFSYVVIDVSELSRGRQVYCYALANDLTIDEAIMRLVGIGLDHEPES